MENPKRISRREALKLIGKASVTGGSILGLWAYTPEPIKRDTVETVSQTAVFTLAELATAPLTHGIKAPIGSRVSEEEVKDISQEGLRKIIYSSLIPTIPQGLLRWIPNALLPNNIAEKWQTNLVQASIFALAGNAKYVSREPDYFPNQKLPIYQVAENMFFWDILRGKGLVYSILAHSLNAFSKLITSRFIYRASPTVAINIIPIVTEGMVASSVADERFR